MRNLATALLLGSILLAGAIAAPTLYAEDQKPSGSTTENGMMGNRDGKDGGGMMGQALIKSHADVLFRDVDSPSAAIPTEMSRSSSSSTITAPIAGRWHR